MTPNVNPAKDGQMTTTRTRAIAMPGTRVGDARYHLYREAFAHANRAIEERFYLEAITVTESLLADRLESRASYLLKRDFGFKTLENLIRKLSEIETDQTLKDIINKDVVSWKASRNRALHEMAKLAHGDTQT